MQQPFETHMQALAGKTALITGAAKRLGAAMAQALCDAGATVVAHYNRSESDVQTLVSALRATGNRAEAVRADLSDFAAVDGLVARAVEMAGPLDILVNNASIFDEAGFAETTPEALVENVNINATAPLLIARRFAEQQRPGVIINMLDTMVLDYDKKHVPYHLSKRMLHTLTRIMAVEFAPDIRVNAIAPGLILPPPGRDDGYLKALAHSNPLCAHGAAADVVAAMLYLVSASFVTGQTLYVDGGRHLRGSMYE